jgi:hypothetical protein
MSHHARPSWAWLFLAVLIALPKKMCHSIDHGKARSTEATEVPEQKDRSAVLFQEEKETVLVPKGHATPWSSHTHFSLPHPPLPSRAA